MYGVGDNFRPIPVPESGVLSGDNFQQGAGVSLLVSEGGAR